ncbi:MAG TPA: CSLREA domain-containing protein [Pirellulales bacterium]|jgi:CSLREA domain-containing protein|nr:CSLREA domain-containing protein [Pirellulales bacterium]
MLDRRELLAVVTVTTVADDLTPNDGSVSLREAITAINAGTNLGDPDIIAQNPGTFGVNDTIDFNIPGTGVHTINVGSTGNGALPALTKPVTIDGYSQTGASNNTLANGDNAVLVIELNGANAGPNADGLLLGATSGGSIVKGLSIDLFSLNGIELQSGGNAIRGNFVGTNPAGTAAQANANDGIRISNASTNTIGGTTPDARNVVSGNALDGIHIVGSLGSPATGNVVEGNFVGTNAAGTGSVGIRPNGTAAGMPEGNGLFGIEVSGGNSNTIGGTTAGARNVVGLNVDSIEVDNGGQNNTVQGNFSGVGADGVTPLGNVLHGIAIRSDDNLAPPLGPGQANEPATSNNLVGGTTAGAGNLVEFNGTAGVAVFGNPLSNNATPQPNVGNAILGNSIFENGRSNPSLLLGIDLSDQFVYPKDDGVTANDANGHGAANDPNNFQNFPVLTSAAPANGGGTTIVGSITQAVSPNTTYHIEFFANNADPQHGTAEGQTFLGFSNVTTTGSGANINVTLPANVSPGQFVTATATDPSNNTSEFSAAVEVPFPTPTVGGIAPTGVPEGAAANLTVTGTNFVAGSVVQLNGTPLATTFGSATQLNAVAPAALLTDEGQASLVVVNPSPGGGASNVQLLTVLEATLPDGTRGTPNQRFVAEVFHDLLGRAVDANGLAAWSAQLDVGVSRNAVVAGIESTLEYRAHVVESLYQTYLHRAADSGGLVSFVDFLTAGGTDEQAAAAIISSPEYFQLRGGGTTDGFLDALFHDTLGRPLDPPTRMAFDNFLAAGGTRQQAAAIVFGSDEYRHDLVAGLFEQYLDRPADPSGETFFVGLLAQGDSDEQVIAAMTAADEYFHKTSA